MTAIERCRAEQRKCLEMTPEYVEAHGGERMRILGLSDWLMEEILIVDVEEANEESRNSPETVALGREINRAAGCEADWSITLDTLPLGVRQASRRKESGDSSQMAARMTAAGRQSPAMGGLQGGEVG